MVSDVAGRVDFMMPAMTKFEVKLDAPLMDGAVPTVVKASMTYVWFKPPSAAAQDRMQKGIIKRIEAADEAGKKKLLEVTIPGLMAAKNTMESAEPPVTMATAEAMLKRD